MSLTIPQGGITFGRSADTRTTGPDIGGEVARLGEAMQTIGTRLVEERDQRLDQTAELQLLDRFNQCELDLSQIGDPDALDDTFRQRAPSGIGEQAVAPPLLDGIGQGLSPEGQERLRLRYEELRIGTGRNVGRTAIELRQSARLAMADYAHDVTTTGAVAAATPEAAARNADQFAATVEELVSSGVWTPEQGHNALSGWSRDVAEARAIRQLSENPQGLLDALDSPDFAPLAVERRESLRAQATARLATADREASAALGQRLREGIRVARAGYDYADADALAADPAVAQHPDGPAFLAAVALQRARPDLARLPPAEQRRILAEETARPVSGGAGFEVDQRSALAAAVEASTEAWNRDPLGHAAELGMLDPVDLPDPANDADNTLQASLRARLAQARALAEGGYTETPVLLRPSERAAFEAATAIDADPAVRSRVASAVAFALGDDAPTLMRQFSDDPVFGYVGGLLNYTEDETLARQIFEGQRAIDRGDVPLPSAPVRRAIWFEEFGDLFRPFGEDALSNQVIGAADALAALRLRGDPESRDPDTHRQVWLQSAHEVMGGTGRYNSNGARGGVQDLNGRLTIMPPGISASEVRTRVVQVATQLVTAEATPGSDFAAAADPLLRQISAGGHLPMAGIDPIDGNTLRNLVFEAAGDGTYFGYVPTASGPLLVTDDSGAPWRLDMRALLEARP